MPIRILIPAPLRSLAEGRRDVSVDAATLGEALDRLIVLHPQLRHPLRAETGEVRPFVNVFVNDNHIPHRGSLTNPLKDGDTIRILPSIAGG